MKGTDIVLNKLVKEIRNDKKLLQEFLTVVNEDLMAFSPHFYLAARVCYSSKSAEQILDEISDKESFANRVPKFLLNLLTKGHMSIFGVQYRVVSSYIYLQYYRLIRDSIASQLNKIAIIEPNSGNLIVNTRLNMELFRRLLQAVDDKQKEELIARATESIANRIPVKATLQRESITYETIHLEETDKTKLTATERAYFNYLQKLQSISDVPIYEFGGVTWVKIGIPAHLHSIASNSTNPLLYTVDDSYFNFWFIIETTRNAVTQILRHTMLNFTQRSNRYTSVRLKDYRLAYKTIARGLEIWKNSDKKARKAKVVEWLELFINRAKEDIQFYKWLTNNGFKKEDARDEIFQRQFTTLNAAGLGLFWEEFLKLRLAKEAQWYTRIVAKTICKISPLCK